ncbi:N-acetylneuraminate synthase family protein [Desulfogranum marinum]|uniref:N-acetylneuraminate synthase family protein n=1 Tax=Desulfogranum marinum TaxID=453220 RepID=UPI0029C83988|nr:N-acetylneuraminate synthase family protein [Desulfogranum marinum]
MKIREIFRSQFFNFPLVRRPYVIAEAGVNHEGELDIAKRLIDEAQEGGADAIKFQTYRAGSIASKYSPAYWDLSQEPTTSQYELFQKYDKFWKAEFEQLKLYCDECDIEFMSTPFDVESATFLNDLMDVFKISSSDITNKPFIEYICKFGKPIILSTGASSLDEISEAVGWIEENGNAFALLHCVLNYPTDDANANLGMIRSLMVEYPDRIVGYSDHTMPKDMKVLEVATLLGAVILEKHFTHDKMLPGNDHYHAMDKEDLKFFRANLERTFTLLGKFDKEALLSEQPARQNARRSLVAAKAIHAGQVIEFSDLTWKRPASGISPRLIEKVVGKMALKDIPEDAALQLGMLK